MIINLYWSLFPSVNIRVFYRAVLSNMKSPIGWSVLVDTAFKRCTRREQQFLTEKGYYFES